MVRSADFSPHYEPKRLLPASSHPLHPLHPLQNPLPNFLLLKAVPRNFAIIAFPKLSKYFPGETVHLQCADIPDVARP
jgi:hypothetical protein